MFSATPAGAYPLVPTRDMGVHISSPVSSLCLRAKDHLEDTKVAVFPRYCAPQKVQTGSAADWRPPKIGDQEGDGRPDHPRRGQATQRWQVVGYGHEATREEGPVQASAVALHDDTGRGSRVRLPPAQPLRRSRSFRLALPC